MSEEENKAIEDLKRLRKGIEILNQVAPEKDETDIKAIDIILHLIDNQQKEIEKLNFENHMIKKWNERLDKNCISKDKIRELLEEYKDTGYYEVEQVLKELLEEK